MEIGDIVRLATVTAVDNDKRLAKVQYDGLEIQSGWLPVLITRDYIPDYEDKAPIQHTEKRGGGAGYAAFENHDHDIIIKPYMPVVNDKVVVLFFPVFNADGVILGGIKPWK